MTTSRAPARRAPATAAFTSPMRIRRDSGYRRCPGSNCSSASLTPPAPSRSVTIMMREPWAISAEQNKRTPVRIRVMPPSSFQESTNCRIRRFMRTSGCLVLALIFLSGCSKPNPEERAMTPRDSLNTMRLSEDFHLELFASEPEVMSPVEMAFDENGKIYVAEMFDYPEDPPPGKPARSRIRLLENPSGDGKTWRNTIFADHVLAVSGF